MDRPGDSSAQRAQPPLELRTLDIVLRVDAGTERTNESVVVRGARAVAERARTFAWLTPSARPALVNGAVGAVVAPQGRPYAVMAFTVADGKIVEIDILSDPRRLGDLELSSFD